MKLSALTPTARFLLALSLVSQLFSAASANELPASVQQALGAARIPVGNVSALVQAVDGGAAAVQVNADSRRNPASVIKLVTTLAALDLLGPSFTWTTELLSENLPHDGMLSGNLYLRGSGDPKLTYDRLWLLLRQLRDRGVSEIRGDLIIDRSAFAVEAINPAEFDGKPLRPYNAQPDALLFNFNALSMQLRPSETGNTIKVTVQPAPDNLQLDNRLRRSTAATCGEWRERLNATPVNANGLTRIVLTGDFPAICGERLWHIQAMRADDLIGGSFRALWRELGGQFIGQVRTGVTPETASTRAVLPGLTLAETVRDINKFSNNVMARQLFLTLARADQRRQDDARPIPASAMPATDARADSVIADWLKQRQLAIPQLTMANGSGLSREAQITATGLGNLLRYAWQSPVMPEFIASLPITAIDGTMRKRLNDSPVAGRAHIKTGSLDGVKTMAGYVLDNQSRRWIVVFLVNHPQAAEARAAMDALLQWVGEGKAAAP